MGINYSLGTGNYFSFIPASYGIMPSIHGTNADLTAIDLDCMVLGAYNTMSYYNNLNQIQNTSMSLFSQLANIGSMAPALQTQGVQGGQGASAATNKQMKEYNQKVKFLDGFFEYYKNSRDIKELKKQYNEIKQYGSSYAEKLSQINEILETLSAEHSDKIKKFADDKAKKDYNKEDTAAKNLATTLKNTIDAGNKEIKDADIDLIDQAIDQVSIDNVLDVCKSFNKQNSDSIVKTLQIRLAKAEKYNGKAIDSEARKALEQKFDTEIRKMCNALIDKADEYDLDSNAQSKLQNLQNKLNDSNCKLATDPGIAKAFDELYVALAGLQAANIDADVQDELDDIFDDNDVTVDGAQKACAKECSENQALKNNEKPISERKETYAKAETPNENDENTSGGTDFGRLGTAATIGAVIGGIIAAIPTFGIGTGAGMAGGAAIGAAVDSFFQWMGW